jgi:hypothetical protein
MTYGEKVRARALKYSSELVGEELVFSAASLAIVMTAVLEQLGEVLKAEGGLSFAGEVVMRGARELAGEILAQRGDDEDLGEVTVQ